MSSYTVSDGPRNYICLYYWERHQESKKLQMMIIIQNNDLRDHLKRFCCKSQDCDLTADDLETIEYLEITTEEYQFWEESDDSVVTSSFFQIEDLEKFPKLIVLCVQDQPLRGKLTLPLSIEEVVITKCLRIYLSIGEESFVIPPSEHTWMWKRGSGVVSANTSL